MKNCRIISFFIIFSGIICSQNSSIEFRISSSETGYFLIPEYIRVWDFENPGKIIKLQKNNNNIYTVNLPNGTYGVSVNKQGYRGCETYFSTEGKDAGIAIYLDPLNTNPLLKAERIKKLVNDTSAFILGYAVDDESGEPVSHVKIKDHVSGISTTTGANGYFEFYLPSECNTKTNSTLTFNSPGYKTEEYKNFEIYPETDFIFTVRLKKFSLKNIKPQLPLASMVNQNCDSCGKILNPAVSGFVVPLNIRVGRNCTGTNCTYAEVYSLETYCKYVLPAEIYSCWGNLAGGMNSLMACAVAVRTYGIHHVYNPISPALYDICDNTYCQYMGNVTSTNTNNAVNNTYRYIITNSAGVVRCEYSAENNNKGCGNGYSGTGSSWPCIYDPVCMNRTPNGHGRGLCQWGTVRWATGTLVSTSSPCSMGTPHSYGTLNWQQILNHYYNVQPYNWIVSQGITAAINSSSAAPNTSNPCSTIAISNNINATNAVSLMIGASIAPAGTSNWISDPVHDIKVNFSQGTGTYSRQFTIPCSAQPGTYDLLTALWYDKDNNNRINQGDFVVSSKLTQNALIISPVGIKPAGGNIPNTFSLYQNFPNPFNPSTLIRFDIAKASYVKLIIFDIMGKIVETIVNEELRAGEYSYEWPDMSTGHAVRFSSGIYYYKLVAVEKGKPVVHIETKKMALIK